MLTSMNKISSAWIGPPSYRPDMNSIEHIWDEIGRGLEELDPQVSEPEATGSCSPNIWQQIPLK